MLLLRVLILVFLSLSVFVQHSHATGAIAFSDDNIYGWCYGYRNGEAARQCAIDYCKSGGHPNCQLTLQCGRGWAAVARGSDGGFGAACEVGSAVNARGQAFLACVLATRGYCTVDTTYSDSGVIGSTQDNADFAPTVYAQTALSKLGYLGDGDIDGVAGRRTREAIRAYQTARSLEPTGYPNQATIDRFVQDYGGPEEFKQAIIRLAERTDMSTWLMKSRPGNPPQLVNQSQTTSEPQKDFFDLVQEMQIFDEGLVKTFGVERAEITKALTEGLNIVSFFDEFKDPGSLSCRQGTGELVYECAAYFVDNSRPAPLSAQLYLFKGTDSYEQAAIIARERSTCQHCDPDRRTELDASWEIVQNSTGQKETLTGRCTQATVRSPAYCYAALTPKIGLAIAVAARPQLPGAEGTMTSEDALADLERGRLLLVVTHGKLRALGLRE